MFYELDTKPKLIDYSTMNFIDNNLKSCHNNRISYYVYFFNFIVFFIFVLVVSCVLYFLSTYKKNPYEVQEKMIKDQEYILDKIKHYKDTHKKKSSMITDLPTIPSYKVTEY